MVFLVGRPSPYRGRLSVECSPTRLRMVARWAFALTAQPIFNIFCLAALASCINCQKNVNLGFTLDALRTPASTFGRELLVPCQALSRDSMVCKRFGSGQRWDVFQCRAWC